MTKIKNVKERVKLLIYENEELRDDDNLLIAQVWMRDLGKIGIDSKKITGFQLMQIFVQKQLTNAESIRRARQYLQQKNVHLRGEKYAKRQTLLQNKVKQELGYGER